MSKYISAQDFATALAEVLIDSKFLDELEELTQNPTYLYKIGVKDDRLDFHFKVEDEHKESELVIKYDYKNLKNFEPVVYNGAHYFKFDMNIHLLANELTVPKTRDKKVNLLAKYVNNHATRIILGLKKLTEEDLEQEDNRASGPSSLDKEALAKLFQSISDVIFAIDTRISALEEKIDNNKGLMDQFKVFMEQQGVINAQYTAAMKGTLESISAISDVTDKLTHDLYELKPKK